MRNFMAAPTTQGARAFQETAAGRFSADRCFSALRAVYDQTNLSGGAIVQNSNPRDSTGIVG